MKDTLALFEWFPNQPSDAICRAVARAPAHPTYGGIPVLRLETAPKPICGASRGRGRFAPTLLYHPISRVSFPLSY